MPEFDQSLYWKLVPYFRVPMERVHVRPKFNIIWKTPRDHFCTSNSFFVFVTMVQLEHILKIHLIEIY